MGAGKDIFGDYLIEKYNFTKLKLGHHIREHVDKYCNSLNIPQEERRKLYVTYAEICRVIFGTDLWSSVTYDSIQNPNNNHIIADGRQWHEYDYWVYKNGFIPIGIKADIELRKERLISRDGVDQSSQFNNMTERQINNIIEKIKNENGIVIENNGTIEQLKFQIDEIMRVLCR